MEGNAWTSKLNLAQLLRTTYGCANEYAPSQTKPGRLQEWLCPLREALKCFRWDKTWLRCHRMTKRFEVSEWSAQKWLRLRRYVTQSITNRNIYDFIITEKSSWNSLLKNASYALQNFNQPLIVQRGTILDLKLLLLSRSKKSSDPDGEKTWAYRVP